MIYLIMQGEYSDRCAIGYTDTRAKAERICADYNSGQEDYWQYVDIEELEELEDKPEVIPYYRIIIEADYRITGGVGDSNYASPTYGWMFSIEGYDRNQFFDNQGEICMAKSGTHCTIKVPMIQPDERAALRIAQDMFFQFLYAYKEIKQNPFNQQETRFKIKNYNCEAW